MNTVYLLTGGNMGERAENLYGAIILVEKNVGNILKRSSIYETAAWGNTHQPDFLNQVLVVDTKLSAPECLQQILSIENEMGRIRNKKNDPRIIDIDILFYNDEIIDIPGLIIPHPEIKNRRFVLTPLHELAPAMIHPMLKTSIKNLLSTCPDKLDVRLWRTL